jgi:RND family efflux transporter MFP subunit
MNKIFFYIKKPYIFLPILAIISIVVWKSTTEQELNIDIEEVIRRDVTEEVSGTARVSAEEELRLSFEIPGVIKEVFVDEGDQVKQGDSLVILNTDIRESEVSQAEANLRASQARLEELKSGLTLVDLEAAESKVRLAKTTLENYKESLEDIKETENTKVANARESLLTSNLEARFTGEGYSSDYSYDPPVVSGTFTGEDFGEYRLTLYKSQTESGYSFRYQTDLEDDGIGTVSVLVPQKIGGKGLSIIFPEDFAHNSNVEWLIEIPNKDSSGYSLLSQTYELAKENRDKLTKEAERRVRDAEIAYESALADFASATAGVRSEQIEAQSAVVEQAQIALTVAKTNLEKSTLRAPIDGSISGKHLSLGEAVSPGLAVFSLVTGGDVHLSINIPEVDVANLSVGDLAEVKFDAFLGESFEAVVTHIQTVADDSSGVATFKTRLDFNDFDDRIKVGMTADVDIVTSKKEDVVAVPGRALIQMNEKSHIRLIEGGNLVYRQVERGLRGSDGWIEIVSGLEAGEKIITYADEGDLEILERKQQK